MYAYTQCYIVYCYSTAVTLIFTNAAILREQEKGDN